MVTVQVAGGSVMDGMTVELDSRDDIPQLCLVSCVEIRARRCEIFTCVELLVPGNNRVFVKPVFVKESQW